jgi:uncharacterized membrane protein YdfJ with MMPL/SSD domain
VNTVHEKSIALNATAHRCAHTNYERVDAWNAVVQKCAFMEMTSYLVFHVMGQMYANMINSNINAPSARVKMYVNMVNVKQFVHNVTVVIFALINNNEINALHALPPALVSIARRYPS